MIKCVWSNKDSFLIVLQDVTEIEQNKKLKEIDQYKDRLLGSVTHDLRTPLNCIITLLEVSEECDE